MLPKDGSIYTENIFDRCRDLVRYDIWAGIELRKLNLWISNFRSPEEQYFAARVLDSLIYRSNRQTIALMKQLFQRIIPDYAHQLRLHQSLQNIYYEMQQDSVDPSIRIVPIVPPYDSPTKSGPTIARMLRRELGFKDKWIIYPHEVVANALKVNAFVFVDDFLGTGLQFYSFLKDAKLEHLIPLTCSIYAPLVGHEEGIKLVRALVPELHVNAVETLNKNHALFNSLSGNFPDGVNTIEAARDFYYKLMTDHKIDLQGPNRRGFGQFELTYAFEHAVPDNSLPILWWAESNDWHPLFNR